MNGENNVEKLFIFDCFVLVNMSIELNESE